MKTLRAVLVYVLLLAAGLAAGFALMEAPRFFKPAYIEGDYSAFFKGRQEKVIVYGTAWCQFCGKTREHLKRQGIQFADLDIEKSDSARAQHVSLGGGPVPMILVGNRRITGYSEGALDKALATLK